MQKLFSPWTDTQYKQPKNKKRKNKETKVLTITLYKLMMKY